MYTKDKHNRVTLRLNDEQFEFVKANADMLDVSPSEFLRMVVNMSMSVSNKAVQELVKGGAFGRENDESNSDNLV